MKTLLAFLFMLNTLSAMANTEDPVELKYSVEINQKQEDKDFSDALTEAEVHLHNHMLWVCKKEYFEAGTEELVNFKIEHNVKATKKWIRFFDCHPHIGCAPTLAWDPVYKITGKVTATATCQKRTDL